MERKRKGGKNLLGAETVSSDEATKKNTLKHEDLSVLPPNVLKAPQEEGGRSKNNKEGEYER